MDEFTSKKAVDFAQLKKEEEWIRKAALSQKVLPGIAKKEPKTTGRVGFRAFRPPARSESSQKSGTSFATIQAELRKIIEKRLDSEATLAEFQLYLTSASPKFSIGNVLTIFATLTPVFPKSDSAQIALLQEKLVIMLMNNQSNGQANEAQEKIEFALDALNNALLFPKDEVDKTAEFCSKLNFDVVDLPKILYLGNNARQAEFLVKYVDAALVEKCGVVKVIQGLANYIERFRNEELSLKTLTRIFQNLDFKKDPANAINDQFLAAVKALIIKNIPHDALPKKYDSLEQVLDGKLVADTVRDAESLYPEFKGDHRGLKRLFYFLDLTFELHEFIAKSDGEKGLLPELAQEVRRKIIPPKTQLFLSEEEYKDLAAMAGRENIDQYFCPTLKALESLITRPTTTPPVEKKHLRACLRTESAQDKAKIYCSLPALAKKMEDYFNKTENDPLDLSTFGLNEYEKESFRQGNSKEDLAKIATKLTIFDLQDHMPNNENAFSKQLADLDDEVKNITAKAARRATPTTENSPSTTPGKSGRASSGASSLANHNSNSPPQLG